MRENFKRCLVKRSEMTRSGAAAQTLPKCKYFNQLQFLQDKVMNKETHSNVSLPPPPSPSVSSTASSGPQTPTPLSSPPLTPTPLSSQPDMACPPEHTFGAPTQSNQSKSGKRRSANNIQEQPNKKATSNMDEQFLNALNDINETTKNIVAREPKKTLEDDEDMHFCKSIVPTLRKLPPRKNKVAKLKIQQLLFELEFDEMV